MAVPATKGQMKERIEEGEEVTEWTPLTDASLKVDETLPNNSFTVGDNTIRVEYKDEFDSIQALETTVTKSELNKYLIYTSEGYFTYRDGQIVLIGEEIGEDDWIDHGLDEATLQNSLLWKSLSNQEEYELHFWTTSEEEVEPLSIEYYTNHSVEKEVTLAAIPHIQLVEQEEDIFFESPVDSFTLDATVPEGSFLGILASNDGGITWKTYLDEWKRVNTSDKEYALQEAMTLDMFNSLTRDEWGELITDKVRFAYILDQDSLEDTLTLNSLSYQLQPIASSTPSVGPIQIHYDELTIEGRLKDLENMNRINLAKLNFKANSLVKAEKYKLHDLVIDTFESDSMKTIESEEVEEKEILAYKVEPNYNHYAHHYDLKDVLNYHIDTAAIIGKQHLYDRGETYGEWTILEQQGVGRVEFNEDHLYIVGNAQNRRNTVRIKHNELIDFSEINNIHADYEGWGSSGRSRVGISILNRNNEVIKNFYHVTAPYGGVSRYPREIRTFDVSDIQEEGYISLNAIESSADNTSGGSITLYELWIDDVIESSTFLNVDNKWYSLSSLGELTEVDKTSNLIEINSSIDNFSLHHDAVMSFIEDKEIKELVFISNDNYSLYFLSGDFIVSAHDSSDGSYKGVSVIQSESEKVLENLKRLWIVSDYEDCTFEYSLDNGETWSSIESDEIKNIENQNGDDLVIKVYLPNETSVLKGLAVGWA